jgi:ribosome-binding factor A
MAKRRFARKPPVGLCAEIGSEDGQNPRFDVKQPQGKVRNRKALQLCRQVEQTLSVALEGEWLRDMTVASVMPAPDSSRLLVTLRFHGHEAVTQRQVEEAIRAAQARLRSAVAAAIHRRKTPELLFLVIRA